MENTTKNHTFSKDAVARVLISYLSPAVSLKPNDSDDYKFYNILENSGSLLLLADGNRVITSSAVARLMVDGGLDDLFTVAIYEASPVVYQEVQNILNQTAIGIFLNHIGKTYETKVVEARRQAVESITFGLPSEQVLQHLAALEIQYSNAYLVYYVSVIRGLKIQDPNRFVPDSVPAEGNEVGLTPDAVIKDTDFAGAAG